MVAAEVDSDERVMEPEPNRTAERPTDRAVCTEFYAGFNRLVTDRGGRDELAATLADDVRWTIVADGDPSARNYTGIDAVAEHVATPLRESAAHLQALPERFVEAEERLVVEGAYVGTARGDEPTFDGPFVHAHELDDGRIRRCRAEIDTGDERRVFDPY